MTSLLQHFFDNDDKDSHPKSSRDMKFSSASGSRTLAHVSVKFLRASLLATIVASTGTHVASVESRQKMLFVKILKALWMCQMMS